MTLRLAVIGGDGIGPEVTAEAVRALEATGLAHERTDFGLGAARYLADGTVLTEEILADLREHDAILLGAVGAAPGDDIPPGLIERGLLLRLRFALDHYVNLRPFRAGAAGDRAATDLVVVREGTEGSYAGEGGFLRFGTPHEVATQGSVNTRMGVERCVRYAFALAEQRPRKHVTLVHKTNVLTFAGDLWSRTFAEVAAGHRDVTTDYQHVDAACMHLVEQPHRYDVIVTDNLFGDIITDLAGAVTGGIGLAASANLNPERLAPSMFEPVHGTAPDIAGSGRANPLAAIGSVAMLLAFVGEPDAATKVALAVDDVANDPATPTLSTSEIGDRVVASMGLANSETDNTTDEPEAP